MTLERAICVLLLVFAILQPVAASGEVRSPSPEKLRQAAFEHYPAIMGREDLQQPVLLGFIFGADMTINAHSVALPESARITSGLLADVFPKQDLGQCESIGVSVLRSPRGVGGQYDKGVVAAWCVLR